MKREVKAGLVNVKLGREVHLYTSSHGQELLGAEEFQGGAGKRLRITTCITHYLALFEHYRTRLTHPAVTRGSRSISGYHSDISSNSGKLKTSRRDAKARAVSLRWVVASWTDRGYVSAKV